MKFKTIFRYLTIATLAILMGCSEDKIEDGATGTLTGLVVSSGDNEPLANVKISTQPVTSTVFTSEAGLFVIESVQVGDYAVQAELDGFVVDFEAAVVQTNRESNVIFELNREVVANSSPFTPVPIAPANNATDLPLSIDFIWSGGDPDEDDNVTYTISLQNDQNDEVLEFQTVTDTTLTVNSGLLNSAQYFWQISADDGVNPPVLSTISSFETSAIPQADYLFVRKIGDNNVIFGADLEGNLIQLTSEANNSWRPRKNSAIGKIAYLQSVGAQTHLFLMNEDGSDKRRLTFPVPVSGFDLNEIDYTWEPNGASILYPTLSGVRRVSSSATAGVTTSFYEPAAGMLVTEIAWSQFNDVIALKLNDIDGYNVSIITVDTDGNLLDTIFDGQPGAAGGLDLNIDGSKVLYWYDTSGLELPSYLPQDARIFIYDIPTATASQIDNFVTVGRINIDPKFGPNESNIYYTDKARASTAIPNIFVHDLGEPTPNETLLESNASMIDFEE
ncbi:carboxypeptidase-like regulatory domain-containing protein [Gilvibacter sp.]|uniref:carboxypeptidase-like regulatory domain-containing protein n=1 Tax=Gilvibacter sp. TaxID=2729997 RepID=UPI0025BED6D5|nr:carboxypeptidase-like regulatory domain-containing protein [Gilvibacter sp.]NQX77017.1 carboxypeptidase regulatory-like domain-containing protein [Gilvibacter sp.]